MGKSLKALIPVCVFSVECKNVVESRVLPGSQQMHTVFFTVQVGWVGFMVCELHWLGRSLKKLA